jgi:hypothetical protein
MCGPQWSLRTGPKAESAPVCGDREHRFDAVVRANDGGGGPSICGARCIARLVQSGGGQCPATIMHQSDSHRIRKTSLWESRGAARAMLEWKPKTRERTRMVSIFPIHPSNRQIPSAIQGWGDVANQDVGSLDLRPDRLAQPPSRGSAALTGVIAGSRRGLPGKRKPRLTEKNWRLLRA